MAIRIRRGPSHVGQMIHFWVPATTATPAEIATWNPDLEPRRYATGVGHNLLELFVRLAREGLDVTVGEEAPARARLVVVFSKSVFQSPRLASALRAGRRSGGRFAVIRSDAPSAWRFPVRPVVEFMPIQAGVRRPWQRWLPPLTQRGLVPRGGDRFGRVRSIGFKGGGGTLPAALLGPGWEQAVAARGLEWLPDVAYEPEAPDQSWHDFAGVDAVLCMRASQTSFVVDRKPPTRLIKRMGRGLRAARGSGARLPGARYRRPRRLLRRHAVHRSRRDRPTQRPARPSGPPFVGGSGCSSAGYADPQQPGRARPRSVSAIR